MKSVAAFDDRVGDRGHGQRQVEVERVHAGAGHVTAPARSTRAVHSLRHAPPGAIPSYRQRALQFAADALLCAAWPSRSPSCSASSTTRGGIPERYVDDARWARSPSSAIGKSLVFELLGLHQKWWRYFRLADLWPIVRALAVASALLVARLHARAALRGQPAALGRDHRLHPHLRPARRRPARAPIARRAPAAASPARQRTRRCSWSAPAPAARWSSASCSSTRTLGARAIGFVDDDPRKRGMRAARAQGARRRPTRSAAILDEPEPDEVVIAIPSAPGVAARQGRRRLPRARDPGPHPADRVRAAARRRPAHPPAARGPGRGRARPRPGRDGARPRRRLPARQDRPRHRRRRLDRLRALPPDRPGAAAAAGAARPRRGQPLRDRPRDGREWHFTRVESVLADCKEASGCSR